MWYIPDIEYSYVEPVATVPDFRNNGLGKAVVYEGINRCIKMGSKKALVISNQQFYHKLGFTEYSKSSLWIKRV
jgi:predicted N-acetyltransferase YhbS